MINVQMTVREIAWLISQCGDFQCELWGRAVSALEAAYPDKEVGTKVTILYVPQDSFIPVIKVIRNYTRGSLKETKEWLDVVRGQWQSTGYWDNGAYISAGQYSNGKPNTLTVRFGAEAIAMAADLRSLGCTVRVGDTDT
jgi:hypothetical protein